MGNPLAQNGSKFLAAHFLESVKMGGGIMGIQNYRKLEMAQRTGRHPHG